MKQLWAPWRIEYILGKKKGEGCVLCTIAKEDDDEKNLILYRGKLNYIVLNRYPYNNGHLMIIPYRHIGELSDLTNDELCENAILTQKSVTVLQKEFSPQGFNIGMNIGSTAGAGIGDHLHNHVVPRWNGDSNFMPVIGEVRVMPQHIKETYKALINSFSKIG